MQKLFLFLYLVTQMSWLQAQTHDTGSGGGKTPEIFVNSSCQIFKTNKKELLKEINKSYPKDKIQDMEDFHKLIISLLLTKTLDDMNKISKDELIQKCGQEKVDKILKENPWLENTKISVLLNRMADDLRATPKGCEGYLYNDIIKYIDFIQIWQADQIKEKVKDGKLPNKSFIPPAEIRSQGLEG